ncbi:hypothetical protein GCM10027610_039250 [Dactylosporangium cerinum]
MTVAAVQAVGGVEDVLAGDFAEVSETVRPTQGQRTDVVEVAPGGFRVAGPGSWASVVQDTQPCLDVVSDAGGEGSEFAVRSPVEGGCLVVVEQVQVVRDVDGAFDRQTMVA